MKRLIFFLLSAAVSMHVRAQVVLPSHSGPVKLTDVIAKYKSMHPDYENTKLVKKLIPGLRTEASDADYQFERWLWYWKQHLDNDGNIVSPAATWQEWQRVNAQQREPGARTTSGSGASWAFFGPDSSEANGWGVGRINMVAFHPTDFNTFWVATPGGGAWKTTNNGRNWTCMTDQLPLLSVSCIAFNPLNPKTIYLCTGDRDANDYFGIGVLKSYDGGSTWQTTGITWTPSQSFTANSMVVNPQDTNSLIVATSDGMFRSFNGGASFTRVASQDFLQVIYRPGDTSTVYATTYIDFSTPTPACAQIWRSTNGGNTWTQQTSLTTSSRITVAVTPAAPNMVLAISADYDPFFTNYGGLDGIYKSSDAGNTFNEIYAGGCSGNLLTWAEDGGGCGGQGWYTLPLAISPTDSNIVYTGGVNSWASADGGVTWTIANQWDGTLPGVAIVHADKHWMQFSPLMPTRLFETNDGGIYYSDNPVGTGVWNNLTNRMGIEEVYRTSVSDIASFTITGAQDVGSKIEHPGGIYVQAYGSDGMTCRLDYADSTVAYASGQMGVIARLDPTAPIPVSSAVDISANIAGGSVEGTGAWVTPFVIEPSCHNCLLAGYNMVYKSMDQGNTWDAISTVLTSNQLERVATTQADSNTIFCTEDFNGNSIYYTHNGGTSWSTLLSPFTGVQYITDVLVDPRDANHIWLSYGGYSSARFAQWTPTGGFQVMNTGLPNVPVYCIAIDKGSRDMYAGTEIGVYYRDSTMTSWAPFTTGMPSIQVTDLSINYATNQIWAATYGRSLWHSPKHTSTAAVSVVPFAPDAMAISPNPSQGNFTVSVKGISGSNVSMRLLSIDGRVAWQGSGVVAGNQVSVNTSGLAAGTYIFELSSGNAIVGKQKLVIN